MLQGEEARVASRIHRCWSASIFLLRIPVTGMDRTLPTAAVDGEC